MSKQTTISEAARLVKNGQTVTIGGTLSQRVPASFVRELARQQVRELFLIKPSPGYDIDVLAAAGSIARVQCGISALEQPFGMALNFRRAVEQGKIEVVESACPAVMGSLQAAAFGIPFQPLAGFEGSEVTDKGPFEWIKDPFTGKETVVVPAIQPDWAIVHVHEADVDGNARIYGTPIWDRLMSRAAKRCIVVAEKILPTAHFVAQPELTVIPSLFVEAVVHAPAGAWPTSILPLYDIDESAMRHFIELSATPAGFARYLDETRAHDHSKLGAAA